MNVHDTLTSIALHYPEELRENVVSDVPRQTFQIEALMAELEPGASVCDLGGGHSLFAPGCAALGLHSSLIGRFSDHPSQAELLRRVREEVFRQLGVQMIESDLMNEKLDLPPESMDAITCFAAVEHFHHSPKTLFHNVARSLKPGGVFFIGAPNCVNLRKRITVPLGRGKWSQMADWYERETFIGHVREPDVDDLLYIVRDMGLTPLRTWGRNWIGLRHPRRLIRLGSRLIDHLLWLRPTLCSDIYVLGRKTRGSR